LLSFLRHDILSLADPLSAVEAEHEMESSNDIIYEKVIEWKMKRIGIGEEDRDAAYQYPVYDD